MFHQGQNFEKGKVYDLAEAEVKALDPKDYQVVGDSEKAEEVKKPKSMTKGVPKDSENK